MELARGVKHFTDSRLCMSIDLGQSHDYTAISIIEERQHSHITVKGDTVKKWNEYWVRHLERLALGTDYVQQAHYVAMLHSRPPLYGTCPIALDDGGVG